MAGKWILFRIRDRERMKMVAKSSIGTTVERQSAWWLKANRGDFWYLDRVLNSQTQKGVHSRGKDMKQNHIQSAGMDPFLHLDRTDNGNGMFLIMGKFPDIEWIWAGKPILSRISGKGMWKMAAKSFIHTTMVSQRVWWLKANRSDFWSFESSPNRPNAKKGVVSPAIDMT